MKILSLLSLATLPFALIEASKETLEACLTAHDELNEHITLQESFVAMLQGYNETCQGDGLCEVNIDEDTLADLKNMDVEDDESEIPSIVGAASAQFGKSFTSHETFINYATACADAGGILDCVDSQIVLRGEAGAAFLKQEEGIQTDVQANVFAFPVCLPAECGDEDLGKVVENAAKQAILKSPKVAEDLTAQSEALIKSVSVEQVCALSGLDTCKLEVQSVGCGNVASPAPSITTTGSLVGGLIFSVAALFSLF